MAKRLYIQLYCARTGESFTLPLNPDKTDLTNLKDTLTYNILNYGEVGIRSQHRLQKLTLTKILPEDSSYLSLFASLVKQLNYKHYTIKETVEMINRWVDDDEIIRVIISGYLNAEFQVENFTCGVRESIETIDYTIDLVEYRRPERIESEQPPKSNITKLKERIINKYIPAQVIGKKGQTVYKLAKLTYGDKWEELAQKNNITDANLDISGKIINMLPLKI